MTRSNLADTESARLLRVGDPSGDVVINPGRFPTGSVTDVVLALKRIRDGLAKNPACDSYSKTRRENLFIHGARIHQSRIPFLTSRGHPVYNHLARPQHCEMIFIWECP
jgi:hypothetical protein